MRMISSEVRSRQLPPPDGASFDHDLCGLGLGLGR
jgi:hypothetical protein